MTGGSFNNASPSWKYQHPSKSRYSSVDFDIQGYLQVSGNSVVMMDNCFGAIQFQLDTQDVIHRFSSDDPASRVSVTLGSSFTGQIQATGWMNRLVEASNNPPSGYSAFVSGLYTIADIRLPNMGSGHFVNCRAGTSLSEPAPSATRIVSGNFN